MKSIKQLFFLSIFLSTLIACDEINERILPSCTGKAGDLLIVADSNYYNHLTGTAIQEIFSQEQLGLPQREALFNLIQVPHQSFAKIFETTRNIIMINIEPADKIRLTVRKDVWASAQLVVTITAPNDEIAAQTIEKNAKVLLDYFNNKEIERLQAKFRMNANSKNAQFLYEHFKLKLSLDELYIVAVQKEDFVWLRKEMNVGGHPVSKGILIYTYPYVSDSTFEISNLVEKRNYYTSKYVSGGPKDSYMISYPEYTPVQKEISLNGVYVNELRGLWDLKGAFGAGPYVNYSFVDEQRNRIICVDGYVYAPKFDKRELIREQEALIKTINF